MNDMNLPYKIWALAPFAPVPEEKFKPEFIDVDLYSIDDAIERLSPVLYLPLPTDLCSEGAVTLKFKKIKEFKPNALKKNNPYLASLSNGAKPGLSSFEKKKSVQSETKDTSSIDDILSMVATSDNSSGSSGMPSSETSPEDSGASGVLKEIFSNADFQKTESAWRGLQTLLKKATIKGAAKISVKIASVSHGSLENVLTEIESLPHSEIPNLVLIDLGFDNTQPSIDLLEKTAEFTDRMMVPACVSMLPEFFRIKGFDQLKKFPYIGNYLDDVSYAKFRKIKALPGAAWLMATCNGFAARAANEFEEQPLVVSPIWAMGTLCALSVDHSGWPMGFTRYNTNRIEDLAMVDCDGKNTAATQALFGEDRIMQLVEAGITPVVGMKNKDLAIMPKEASLTGESIKFQMFINRIIEMLINLKEGKRLKDNIEQGITDAITQIFVQTGHQPPDDVFVKKDNNTLQDRDLFNISFSPPGSVISGLGKIEFSFAW